MKITLAKAGLAAFLTISASLISAPSQATTPLLPPSATVSSNGLNLSVEASSSEVHVTWTVNDETQSVILSKDGADLTAATGSGEFVDTNVNAGEEPIYSVRTEAAVTASELLATGFDANLNVVKAAKRSTKTNAAYAPVGIPFKTSLNFFGLNLQPAAAATVDNTRIRYQAFVPSAYESVPRECLTSGDIWNQTFFGDYFRFNGDNRTFDATPASSRIRFDVTADWLNSGNLTFQKSVGSTHKYQYTSSGTLVADTILKAPTSSMTYTNFKESSTVSMFQIKADTQNPFCAGSNLNGIYYTADFALYRNGTYSIDGVALDYPNHEIWIEKDNSGTWRRLVANAGTTSCLYSINTVFGCTNSWNLNGIY
ncbi:MAG: hypothetical protein RL196_165 [Actinomycetota bacterium]|jgi:hypothetical protein